MPKLKIIKSNMQKPDVLCRKHELKFVTKHCLYFEQTKHSWNQRDIGFQKTKKKKKEIKETRSNSKVSKIYEFVCLKDK